MVKSGGGKKDNKVYPHRATQYPHYARGYPQHAQDGPHRARGYLHAWNYPHHARNYPPVFPDCSYPNVKALAFTALALCPQDVQCSPASFLNCFFLWAGGGGGGDGKAIGIFFFGGGWDIDAHVIGLSNRQARTTKGTTTWSLHSTLAMTWHKSKDKLEWSMHNHKPKLGFAPRTQVRRWGGNMEDGCATRCVGDTSAIIQCLDPI